MSHKKKVEPVKVKRVPCFTQQQQDAFEKLPLKKRKYVEYRGQGNRKTDSYIMAGYSPNKASQGAHVMEKDPLVAELIACLQGQTKVRELTEEDSELNRQIDALATQESAEKMLEVIEGADGETARRIAFYRDIINGKIKDQKKTVRRDAGGKIIETKTEETSSIESRMKARKELDKILGLTQMPDLGSLQMGDITINIVDASKEEEVKDERNNIELKAEDVTDVSKKEKFEENVEG